MSPYVPIVIEQKRGKPTFVLVTVLNCAFKLLALIFYLTANILQMKYTFCFVLVVILLSADFWLVKNVSGRLLAGLRWWNVVAPGSGDTIVWHYESWTAEDRQVANRAQVNVFWMALLLQQIIWTLIALFTLFSLKLNWFILAFFALCMNSANLYGYLRCKFLSRQSSQDEAMFSWKAARHGSTTMISFLVTKTKELFTGGRRYEGYTPSNSGGAFMETF